MEETFTSENTQEVAEPEVTTSEITEDNVNTDEDVVESTENEHTVQSAEDNARYAAARRRAEQEYAERQRLDDEEFARRFADYENPITHQPIRSRQDYFAALDAQERLQMERSLAEGNVSTDVLNSYIEKQINNNPTVLQAQQIIQNTQQAQIEKSIADSVKEIQKLDASVKSIDDLMSSDKAEILVDYVRKGMSLVDAYKVANFDALMTNKSNGAKQAAINNIKGTQHLNTTDGVSASGESLVDIPQSELGAWKRAYPDLSLKEITKKYNKTL